MSTKISLDLISERGPDPWGGSWENQLSLDRIISRDVDGTPHSIREFVWPYTAYSKGQRKFVLHFYYWNKRPGPLPVEAPEVSPEREARIRELQFLMTRQLYYGNENAPQTLAAKLETLHCLARFSELRSCTIRDVLTSPSMLDAFSVGISEYMVRTWVSWIKFLQQLDPVTQVGFVIATPQRWKELERRNREYWKSRRQHTPLPTSIYAELINNLSAELDCIEEHAPRLLMALRDALVQHHQAKVSQRGNNISVGREIIEKYGLGDYLLQRGYRIKTKALNALSGVVTEIFLVCKLQIHIFSGMRHDEARTLPYHCMIKKTGEHGRTHSLIAGVTTKFNKGKRRRTHWVTTDREGFRAIRLAQQFASLIFDSLGLVPSKADTRKDEFPLFPSLDYLPWGNRKRIAGERLQPTIQNLYGAKEELNMRLFPTIKEDDVSELEEIDPFRTWRDEPKFTIGQSWPLTTHQLRRSLALYANASGLVHLPSLRRQLQHITREMSLYYGRGSTFCKNFVINDPDGYKKHIAIEWQDANHEAMILAFTREVLNSNERMFGGAGTFYQKLKERGEVITRGDVTKRVNAGILSYRSTPFGGCTKPGTCDKRKGLALIDISCATDGCKNLVGKHSNIIRVIQLKRAAMAHITQGSIEGEIEREELQALESVERRWRPQQISLDSTRGTHD